MRLWPARSGPATTETPMTQDDERDATERHPRFHPGQRVRDLHGVEHTVRRQDGCQVFMLGRSGWWHPSKIRPVAGGAR